jgi:hypothetical protein
MLSERRRAFIEANPALVDPENEELVGALWRKAMRMGFVEDTPEIDQFVVDGLRFGKASEQAPAQQAAPAPPQRRTEASQPEPMPAPKKALPMVASPSREVPTANGTRQSFNVTLSPAEREAAHFSYHHLPPAQAELEYARQKSKLERMKRDGSYSDQGRG